MTQRPKKERFSIAPILSASHLQTVSDFAAAAGVNRSTVHRWMRSGVDVWTADSLCCKVAQIHPYLVYGDDWFAADDLTATQPAAA